MFPPISEKYNPCTTTKTKFPTIISEGGVGSGNEIVRQNWRRSKAQFKKDSIHNDLEIHRNVLLSNGVYSCTQRCPETNRYCTKKFLSYMCFQNHLSQTKCIFQKGISSHDKLIYTAVQPGSTFGAGTHYNRGSNTGLFKEIMESPPGTIGSENAKCYGMFHRPDDKKHIINLQDWSTNWKYYLHIGQS